MKILPTMLFGVLAALLLTGCFGAGVGQRFAGNQQFVLKQRASDLTLPPSAAVAVNGNETARQGASGGIVNVFFVGENSASLDADKTVDAMKAAAALAGNDNNGDAKGEDTEPPKAPQDPKQPNAPPKTADSADSPPPRR